MGSGFGVCELIDLAAAAAVDYSVPLAMVYNTFAVDVGDVAVAMSSLQ